MNDYPWGEFALGLAPAAGAAFAVMLLTFLCALRLGVHRIVDIAWGAAFAAVALTSWAVSRGEGDAFRSALVAVLTCVWGLRLVGHIALRSRGHGEDPRYEKFLAKGSGNRHLRALRTVYLLQGALVWLVSLPVQAAMYVPGSGSWAVTTAALGCALWAVGMFFEAVGDHQLARFKADPAHKGLIMDRGLWSWTRHPNYFGDFCVWWGLFLLTCTAPAVAAAVLISPLVMSFLLTRGSGTRLMEEHMSGRPGWDAYTARTNRFFPWPPRSSSQGARGSD